MKKHSRIIIALGGAVAAIAATGCSAGGSAYTKGNPVKIGLICLHDTSSTYDKNFIDSMNRAATALGNRVNGSPVIKTGIAENNDSYVAAKDLVKQGCNVIFADSFGHEGFMLKAAKEFPNVTFCHHTGTLAKISGVSNFHNAFASIYEGRFLAGYAAGLKLQALLEEDALGDENFDDEGNVKLGYVGAFPYAEVVSGYTSWFLGVREVVSNVVMDVTFTNSWYDFDAEKAGARALYDRGAAIISQHADSMGAPGECETLGVPNVTYNVPTATECPKTYTAYSKIDWAPYYQDVVNSMYDGTAIPGETNYNYTGTIANNSVVYDCASAEDKAEVEAVKAQLIAKTRRVFDCSKFTVKGQHLTSYMADVDTDDNYTPDTQVIKTEGGITFFDESTFRSAPYFDINIDGITKLN